MGINNISHKIIFTILGDIVYSFHYGRFLVIKLLQTISCLIWYIKFQGEIGWYDKYHQASSWVKLRVRDINDNVPSFTRNLVRVTLLEDTSPGTLVDVLTAQDPDSVSKSSYILVLY